MVAVIAGRWLLYMTEISTVSKPSALQCKQTTLLFIYRCSILRRNDFRPESVFLDGNIVVGKTFYIGIHVHYPLQNAVLQREFDKQEQRTFVHIYIDMKRPRIYAPLHLSDAFKHTTMQGCNWRWLTNRGYLKRSTCIRSCWAWVKLRGYNAACTKIWFIG